MSRRARDYLIDLAMSCLWLDWNRSKPDQHVGEIVMRQKNGILKELTSDDIKDLRPDVNPKAWKKEDEKKV